MKRGVLIAAAASTLALMAAPEMQQNAPSSEVSVKEEAAVFQSKVTLIEVPVVVRDRNGKTVGNLRQEDFQLFDKGRPQIISRFSIERAQRGKPMTSIPTADGAAGAGPALIAPDHFIGFLFDDTHMRFEDVAYTRMATQKFLAANLKPGDRVAVFTTSGLNQLAFTDDRDAINREIAKIGPHPYTPPPGCPGLSFVDANRIISEHDTKLQEQIANGIVHVCAPDLPTAMAKVQEQSAFVMHMYEQTLETTVGNLIEVLKKMAEMPGQRTLVMASSGILTPPGMINMGPAINRAIKSNVVINTLDSRGLGTPMTQNDAYTGYPTGVLAELASGTGGRFIQNTNDLDGGVRQLAEAPEVYYVLGFSPQNNKPDGSFHSLKVSLSAPAGLTVQARLGYYAPTHLASAEEDAKEEVTQALFSHDEMNDIPAVMNTRFFKSSEKEARLTVTSRVDVRRLRFRKSGERNLNSVRVVCALFDRDGNILQADAKTIEMNLMDTTLGDRLNDGIPVRSDFTVAPGTYVIRLVLRDAEGQTMTAQNGAVRIP